MKSKRNFAEKPYNRCLFCEKRRSVPRQCNGPRTGSMETERWREYMRDIKEVDGLTYEEMSARTGGLMSAQSIQNTLAPGATGDLTREKARIIENAVFGVQVAAPCPFDFLPHVSDDGCRAMAAEAQVLQMHKSLELMGMANQAELDAVRADCKTKVDFLMAENERLHKIIERLINIK